MTFSGGEPFSQAEGFTKLARLLKEKDYEVASYSGYTFEQLLGGTQAQRDLLSQLDVLIDGPFVLAERSLELNFGGSRNQRILNVPESLKAGYAVEETRRAVAGHLLRSFYRNRAAHRCPVFSAQWKVTFYTIQSNGGCYFLRSCGRILR